MSVRKSLKERAQEFKTLLPFMEGKDKGEMERLQGSVVTINEYGFLTDNTDGKEKEYVCFTVQEDPQHFYFGGQVLTDNMKELEADGYHDDIVKDGLPALFEKKQSKNKRSYTSVEFYPEG